ncbi:MAG: UDP-N-acetylmuramate dehydrogenase [Planctomycetota bacterium]|jgi:UDP-N-acetylmuramate dehydrogenase
MVADNRTLIDLGKLNVGDICVSEPLKKHTTWKIGGPADFLVCPLNIKQFQKLRQYIHNSNIASIVIGRGSNLLFDDAGFRGIVISVGQAMSAFSIEGVRVRSEAGISVPRLARAVGLAGLTGLEHTIGIPGTLGGLVAMNGGSHRRNIGEVVETVEAMDCMGQICKFKQEKCSFSYRKSIFQDSSLIVVRVEMKLKRGKTDLIRAEMLRDLRERRSKFPRRLPNCGSVFASTVEMFHTVGPPGKLIEDAGLKGLRVGDAEVSHKHANFIVNMGNAKATDVCELIRQIRKRVHDNTNFWMSCEVKYISSDGTVQTIYH